MSEQILEGKVAAAILELIDNGLKPSQEKVIKLVGGSYSTIGPIFNEIKIKFDNFAKIDELCKQFKLKRHNANKLFNENSELKAQLNLLQQHNEALEKEMHNLKEKVTKIEIEKNFTEKLYQELKQEREIILSDIKEGKDQQIAMLLEELSATHKENSKQFSDFSFSYEDKLVKKEVELINLKSKLEDVNRKLQKYQDDAMPQNNIIQNLKKENLSLVHKVASLEKAMEEVNGN